MTDMTKELWDAFIAQLFAEGKTNLVIGPRGSGKTTLAVYLVRELLAKGYFVLSNIIMKRCTGINEDGIRLFEDGQAYPERYIKVRSFAEMFSHIGAILAKDRSAKIVWINDEAAVSFGAYQSVFMRHQKALIDFMTLARKFNVSVLMISVASQLVHSKLRSSDTGFLGATLRKDVVALRKWGGDAMKEFGQKAVFIVEWTEYMQHPDDVLVLAANGVTTLPLCKPQHMADIGDIVFDSKASATFTVGTYPGTNKQFNVAGMLTYISDCTSEEVPGKINDYIALHGEIDSDYFGGEGEGGMGDVTLDEMGKSSYLSPHSPAMGRVAREEIVRQLDADPQATTESDIEAAERIRPIVRENLRARGNLDPANLKYPTISMLRQAIAELHPSP